MTLATLNLRSVLRCAVLVVSLLAIAAKAQLTPSADSYINTASSNTNYGASKLLDVESTQTSFIRFDLSAIPAGYTGTNVTKASLKLFVNTVPKSGSFNIDYVNGSWSESTLDASNAPALGTTIAASVPLTTAEKNQYILVDITPAVQEWLNGTANDGIALVANSPLSATFDSKESTTTSHSPELDIVFAGDGSGTITGITTASGSGLTGGGTSGTLNLSLITSCSSGQILEWSGSAWECTNPSGGGTITGVTAGTDLTGGGKSGNVTLNLDITKVPQLETANAFTGNQTVSGNVSATGLVTGSAFQIGSNLFALGSYSLANAFLGFAGNTTMTGSGNSGAGWQALYSNTTGYSNTADGANALYSNGAGYYNTANGVDALFTNSTGVYNTAVGVNTLYFNNTGSYNTATGVNALDSNTNGSNNTATGVDTLALNSTGAYNTADGVGALYANTSGSDSTASGFDALYSNTSGYENTASGVNAMYSNTIGFQNTASGVGALSSNTSGIENTAVGYAALGNNTTGNDLTCVGDACGATKEATRNATAIGAHAVVGASNSLVLGGTGQYAVKVGIGTTTPSNILTIAQGAGHPLSDGWATFSSRRWKTNIQTLHGALETVEKLRGVSYDLKANGQREIGVIAEEVGAVLPEVVTWEKNGKDAQSVDYGRLTALLVEATKEQQALIHQQHEEIRAQQVRMRVQQAEIQAERKRGDAQDALIVRLSLHVKAMEAALKTSNKKEGEVRTAKAEATAVKF